ncbi:dihydrodipicolinate reductase [Geoglobus ahangari]|uniref:4-hydroxy-tetrahydrodipicolinate reductase n=2 Tax=Geoglobus ahangari TaxID=113653 RepID=A0A0F7IG23_9EURY|nr:4-hydroxy-tetrahydrodipicolinate reductase [Geoglobus ahangari]AKG92128.1 dihydrodipicolinate reductase [Geoglobus ahangari]
MRIAVHGAAGRMGRLVIKNAVEEGLEVVQAFDVSRVGEDAGEVAGVGKLDVPISSNVEELSCDVVVDFSVPSATMRLLEVCSEKGIKAVVGTTGFSDEQRERIGELASSTPVVLSPNFSVGVNIFWKALEMLAEKLSDYDMEIVEIHHRFKRDAPSGTALKAGEVLKDAVGKDLRFVFGREGESLRSDEEIGIFAVRGGDVVGEHTVFFIGFGERIELTHRAWNREAFSRGAIRAAKWIAKVDKPGLYSMNDVLGI